MRRIAEFLAMRQHPDFCFRERYEACSNFAVVACS
jgi:hypothetical protein